MIVGGLLGMLFVALLRRVMVEDKDLKFPKKSVAAGGHATARGRRGQEAHAMAIGASVYLAGAARLGLP